MFFLVEGHVVLFQPSVPSYSEAWSGVAYAELRSDALGSSYEVQFDCEKKHHGPNTTGKFMFPNFQILRCQVPC